MSQSLEIYPYNTISLQYTLGSPDFYIIRYRRVGSEVFFQSCGSKQSLPTLWRFQLFERTDPFLPKIFVVGEISSSKLIHNQA
jgi:hypothetical protein